MATEPSHQATDVPWTVVRSTGTQCAIWVDRGNAEAVADMFDGTAEKVGNIQRITIGSRSRPVGFWLTEDGQMREDGALEEVAAPAAQTAAEPRPDTSKPTITDLAAAICAADDTWEHHDQTDDHPCSACLAKVQRESLADILLAHGHATWDRHDAQCVADIVLAEWATPLLTELAGSVQRVQALLEGAESAFAGIEGGGALTVPSVRAALEGTQD